MSQYVYMFGGGTADGDGTMRDLLGGKGSGLAEMSRAGVPVPPGFTIVTDVCNIFFDNDKKVPAEVDEQIWQAVEKLEGLAGKKLGDAADPLLLSVRSGAKFSMPGMMNTILNLGLNDETVEGLAAKTGNPRFAYDCYRRFIQMFGEVALGIDMALFDEAFDARKHKRKAKLDTDLTAEDLKAVIAEYKKIVQKAAKREFPQDTREQLLLARNAVFMSWWAPKASYYRKMEKISDRLGTACNIQTMVFGNMGETSCTGVGFTRDPGSGEKVFYGEFLVNAQGEDVVAGIRTPQPISELEAWNADVYNQLRSITANLEKHYKDMQDFEFTVQEGVLYMLQTRNGKRTGPAAVKVAVDMAEEGLIDAKTAVMRVAPAQLDQLLHPVFDVASLRKLTKLAQGIDASPGAAVGRLAFTAERAVEMAADGPVILIRKETTPDDIHGMDAAKGIVTAIGGKSSHAAVVARGMGRPCVVGCGAISINERAATATVKAGDKTISIKEGDWVSMNGTTGDVYLGQAQTNAPDPNSPVFARFMKMADEFRGDFGVRANADIPRDAKAARSFGAGGIGLCRTEHMFFAEDRLPIVRRMILAETEDERERALGELLPIQRGDFAGILREMAGMTVVIRLIDPPLHEFLPPYDDLLVEVTELRVRGNNPSELAEKERLLREVAKMREQNPMLGLRGIRLGIMFPGIIDMQVRAILEAACQLAKEGVRTHPEIMIPLVGHVNELKIVESRVRPLADRIMAEQGVRVRYKFGTMIEVPRACVVAGEIAQVAEFFSFGSNDLTQLIFGFSRDDAEGKFLLQYVERKILPDNPFQVLDRNGVGALIEQAVRAGRAARPDIELGICGEHGGEPQSVEFCHRAGLSYVSCSPYRVPTARLAAAQAVLKEKRARAERDR